MSGNCWKGNCLGWNCVGVNVVHGKLSEEELSVRNYPGEGIVRGQLSGKRLN